MSSMSVSTQRAWLHLTPQHTRVIPPHNTHTLIQVPHTPFPLFQLPLTQSAMVTSVSPVGMVTLPSPRQVTLARPNAHTGNIFEGVECVCVCMSMLIWHFSKPHGTVPLPSRHLTVCFLSPFLFRYSTHYLLQISWALSFKLWCGNSRILHCWKYT